MTTDKVQFPSRYMTTDQLLDYYNHYNTLYELFGDSEYKVYANSAMNCLKSKKQSEAS